MSEAGAKLDLQIVHLDVIQFGVVLGLMFGVTAFTVTVLSVLMVAFFGVPSIASAVSIFQGLLATTGSGSVKGILVFTGIATLVGFIVGIIIAALYNLAAAGLGGWIITVKEE